MKTSLDGAPRTQLALDRPMVAVSGLLDYREQQVEALAEVAANFERDRAKLVIALRRAALQLDQAANTGKFNRSDKVSVYGWANNARAVLRSIGEEA